MMNKKEMQLLHEKRCGVDLVPIKVGKGEDPRRYIVALSLTETEMFALYDLLQGPALGHGQTINNICAYLRDACKRMHFRFD